MRKLPVERKSILKYHGCIIIYYSSLSYPIPLVHSFSHTLPSPQTTTLWVMRDPFLSFQVVARDKCEEKKKLPPFFPLLSRSTVLFFVSRGGRCRTSLSRYLRYHFLLCPLPQPLNKCLMHASYTSLHASEDHYNSTSTLGRRMPSEKSLRVDSSLCF